MACRPAHAAFDVKLNAPGSENALDASVTSDRLDVVPPDLEPLDALAIELAIQQVWSGTCAVEGVTATGSTNDDLSARARRLQPGQCAMRAANFQSAGRGRHGRAWHAKAGDALLFSVAMPVATTRALPAVTLACSVALADCLAVHGVIVQLKWPNDVRIEGRKLAGLLTELVADRQMRHTLIVGVGVNWRLDAEARRAIGQPAVALADVLPTAVDRRREWWIGILGGAILMAVDRFIRYGFDSFQSRFNELLEARGQMVDVIDRQRQAQQPVLSGRAVEVDQSGSLIVEAQGVLHAISSGEVTMQAPHR